MTLETLQQLIQKHKYDAFIITRNNLFLGQDTREDENKIRELTGFSGSAGTLVVFADKAVLLVDGRYEIQAALETDPTKVSVKLSTLRRWLQETFPLGRKTKIAYDPWCHSIKEIDELERLFPDICFIADPHELTAPLQSAFMATPFNHEEEFSGISRDEKLAQIAEFIQQQNLDAYLFTAADDVSWLLNLRSDALLHTPILRAFALVSKDSSVILFADNLDIPEAHPLRELGKHLKTFAPRRLGLDLKQTPRRILDFLSSPAAFCALASPISKSKAVKNPIELQGIRTAHHRDGVALINFLYWLEQNYSKITELDVVAKLHEFRAHQPLYYGESFATIAASAAHGAIVHYQPDENSNMPLGNNTLLLLDSGAQYFDGTTDVTRTIALGTPTKEMIHNYTLVLKSHIALSATRFPPSTSGIALDAIARRPLWQENKNYNHGTGHGVGCFLNVHENPPSLSPHGDSELKPGMITSIEPGYYIEGSYGIRIENLAEVKNLSAADEPPLYGFEFLTLVPLDKRLIDKYLLSEEEVIWINHYHQTIWEQLSQKLAPDEKQWLQKACAPL